MANLSEAYFAIHFLERPTFAPFFVAAWAIKMSPMLLLGQITLTSPSPPDITISKLKTPSGIFSEHSHMGTLLQVLASANAVARELELPPCPIMICAFAKGTAKRPR